MITIRKAAKAIGIPVRNWPGRCSTIASAFLEHGLVKGRYQYGIYRGPISAESSCFSGRAFTHHAWIVNGEMVIDPTRWVFEAVRPYIYVGPVSAEYDFGGNALRMFHRRPAPDFNPSERTLGLDGLSETSRSLVKSLLKSELDTVSHGQIMWLGNLDPSELGSEIRAIYGWLVDNRLGAVIPIDNRMEFLGV